MQGRGQGFLDLSLTFFSSEDSFESAFVKISRFVVPRKIELSDWCRYVGVLYRGEVGEEAGLVGTPTTSSYKDQPKGTLAFQSVSAQVS